MTVALSAPEYIRVIGEAGDAAPAWRQAGYSALEVLVEVTWGHRLLRLAAPGRSGWLGAAQKMITPGQMWTELRMAAKETAGPVRVLLARRDDPRSILAVLAESTRAVSVGEAAAWIGWPTGRVGTAQKWWPETVRERLSARGNDYWVVDATARLLGLSDLVTAEMSPVVFAEGVSVVVPARDVHDVLPGVLESICVAATTLPRGTPWECVVVDDADTPPVSLPAGLPEQVRLLRAERRAYCGGARNLGLTRARYGAVVFCDADTHLAPNYLTQHCLRQLLAPNLITVSLRERLPAEVTPPARMPRIDTDSRAMAHYTSDRLGLIPITKPITVRPIKDTREFRDFGYARLLGPTDLPFMVKGNNLALSCGIANSVQFPPDFIGWGPEDVCFAAKCIARGAFVIPVLSTGVFHREHPPRSGSEARRDAELLANLARHERHLDTDADADWRST